MNRKQHDYISIIMQARRPTTSFHYKANSSSSLRRPEIDGVTSVCIGGDAVSAADDNITSASAAIVFYEAFPAGPPLRAVFHLSVCRLVT